MLVIMLSSARLPPLDPLSSSQLSSQSASEVIAFNLILGKITQAWNDVESSSEIFVRAPEILAVKIDVI